jgi:multicomponent Na+:H+ antiporter subunit C
MILIASLCVAVIFGAGTALMLRRQTLHLLAGTLVTSNAAILLLLAGTLGRSQVPIHPLAQREPVSDPLVQALALTAVVIGFALAALLLALVHRVYDATGSLDMEALVPAAPPESPPLSGMAEEEPWY